MSIWSQLLQELENFPRDVRVSPRVDPEELRAELERHYPFDAPVPLETLTEEVIRMLCAWTVHVTHPRYFGLFNPSVPITGESAPHLLHFSREGVNSVPVER